MITNQKIILPRVKKYASSVWHQFVIRTENRNKLKNYLQNNGISTIIHYPIPSYLSEAYKYLGYKVGDYPITEEYANKVLSLPLYNGMTKKELDYVVNIINMY